ncbi:CHAT domain-containing protein [Catellatospora sp. NPDC049609]|uniref:CHAT domain-containing protein n=1 Tax=Catellatospora sp. NPDC049609 TaxID=3155505 RepID=UPI00342390D9
MDEQTNLETAYLAAPADSTERRRAAYRLASVLLLRYVTESGAADDRDRAILLFEESLAGPGLGPQETYIAWGATGLLLMQRAFPAPLTPDSDGTAFMAFLMTMLTMDRADPARRADAARAESWLQRLADHAPADSPVRQQFLPSLAVLKMLGWTGPPDLAAAMQILNEPAAALPGDQRAIASAVRALIRAEDPTGMTPEEANQTAAELAGVIELMPPHPVLRARLRAEIATTVGQLGQATGSPELLAAAPELAGRSLEALGEDPARQEVLRQFAGLLLSAEAARAGHGQLDRLMELADEIAADESADPVQAGKDRYLRGMILMLRGQRDSSSADLTAAAGELHRAIQEIPADDPIVPFVVATLGALYNDRAVSRGVLDDAEAGQELLRVARAIHDNLLPPGTDSHLIAGLQTLTQLKDSVRDRNQAGLHQAVTALRSVTGGLPPTFPMRSRLDAALGIALISLGTSGPDTTFVDEGLAALRRAGRRMPTGTVDASMPQVTEAVADLIDGLLNRDPDAPDRAIGMLGRLAADDSLGVEESAAVLSLLAQAHQIRHDQQGAAADRAAAIAYREQALAVLPRTGHPRTAPIMGELARAYRQEGTAAGRARSIRVGLDSLRARGLDVLLQSNPSHGLAAARDAAADASRLARWCWADGELTAMFEAVELGRGLVLHASTTAAQVPGLLLDIGQADLALEWERAGAVRGILPTTATPDAPAVANLAGALLDQGLPMNTRSRILEALSGTPAARSLDEVPSPAAVGAALAAIGATALAYLIPGDEDQPGVILVVTADGAVRARPAPALKPAPARGATPRASASREAHSVNRRAGAAWDEQTCEWAWTAAIGPLLEELDLGPGGASARVVLVPTGALGAVPWHAAREPVPGGHRYAADTVRLTYAASARQLVEVAGRPAAAADNGVILVGDPTRDLPGARAEAELLRAVFYPKALLLDGGSPEELLRHLPGPDSEGPALLHLACHARAGASLADSYLLLADRAGAGRSLLPVDRILRHATGRAPDTAGGLVILAACESDLTTVAPDESITLSTALLAAGFTGAVGTRWPVADLPTAYLMTVFHHHLRELGLPADEALHRAQRWMRDPHRADLAVLKALPPVAPADLAATRVWAAFSYHGR